MIFVCEEVKEGDFYPLLSTSEMHLENGLVLGKKKKKTQIKLPPTTTITRH